MILLRRIPNYQDDDWVGYWVIKSRWLEIIATKDSRVYPNVTITFYINTPYFLRFNFELRYRE